MGSGGASPGANRRPADDEVAPPEVALEPAMPLPARPLVEEAGRGRREEAATPSPAPNVKTLGFVSALALLTLLAAEMPTSAATECDDKGAADDDDAAASKPIG